MFESFSALFGIVLLVTACGESMPTMSLQTPPPAPPPPAKAWMVFFDTDSSAVSQQGAMTVTNAANVAKSMPNAKVTITGYTDTEGNPAYNQQLSVRRADAVRKALESNGIAPQSIAVNGAGEGGLLVETADQTKNEKNRRVQIVVQ
jgi:OOP family OmpA-OmpF porin